MTQESIDAMNTRIRTLAAATAVLTAAALLPTQAVAADTAAQAPSVVGHPYDALPYANPTVEVAQIDNSAKPAALRNPIGQDEGVATPDDLDANYYSADAAALSYDGKLFIFTGHDEAAPTYGSFDMHDWGVYVTDDPAGGRWTHYKDILQADLFDWATGDGAYAGHVAVDDGGTAEDPSDDWFYYYIPVKDRNAPAGADPFSIGVARSRSPLGPWEDAIGEPLLTTTQTGIETIDPAFFVDGDGKGYLHFGTFNSQLAVRMATDSDTGRTSYTQLETVDGSEHGAPKIFTMRDADALSAIPDYDPEQDVLGSAYAADVNARLDTAANGGSYANGPKGFFEAAWVFERDGVYYNVYDGGKPGSGIATCVESNYQACVQYSTASDPLGPWTYQGVLLESGSSTTMHPSVLPFGDTWWVTYHTGDKAGGTDFRRAVSIDEVSWADGRMNAQAHPTKAERLTPSDNVAPYATVSATYTETASWKGAVNDGRVLQTAVVPPNHWTNYRGMPQAQSVDALIYQWDGAVRIDSATVWFDVDSNALRAPASWKLRYLDEQGDWHDVPEPSGYPTATGADQPNVVTFAPVTATALELDMTAQPVDGGYASIGVAEWQVHAVDDNPTVADPSVVTTATGIAPTLPSTIHVTYGGEPGVGVDVPVIWRPVDPASYAQAGSFTVQGVVAGVPGNGSDNDPLSGNVTINVQVEDGYAPSGEPQRPTVRVALAGVEGNKGWKVTQPVAIVSGQDPSGAPLAKLELKVGAGGWQTVAAGTNSVSVPVAGEGLVRVHAKATTTAGRVSVPESAEAWVDTQAPVVTSSVDAATRTMALSATDDGSGLAGIEYRLDDGDWTIYQDGQAIVATSPARQSVTFRATDVAGNKSTPVSADIPSDTSVPLVGYIERDAVVTDPSGAESGWTKGAAALNDGVIIPDGCTVENECIWGTWPNVGEMTLEYAWDRDVVIDSSRVQFTSDQTDPQSGAGLQIPRAWRLQYWDAAAQDGAGAWADIPDATYTTERNAPGHWAVSNDGWSEATWPEPVTTGKLRLVMQSFGDQPQTGSTAVAEWQVHAVAPDPEPGPDPDPDPDPDPNPDPDPEPEPEPEPNPGSDPDTAPDSDQSGGATTAVEQTDSERIPATGSAVIGMGVTALIALLGAGAVAVRKHHALHTDYVGL